MTERMLTLRELNRTTLARQMLLQRAEMSAAAAIERLVGMQSQALPAPFIGLWTRLKDFQRAELSTLIEQHAVVKATLMRGTLHLFTAADYLRFRTTLQPALSSAGASITKSRGAQFDVNKILDAARDFISEQPRSFAEISAMLEALEPGVDIGAMRYTVRTTLPLVQVPVSTGWSYPGNPTFTLADSWLGRAIDPQDFLRELVLRYLAGFGPASVKDTETWSYIPKLKDIFETLRPQLLLYRDEKKRELFDLPDAPPPDGDLPAPVRFLPEFDNLLLSHDKRTRVLDDAYRPRVWGSGNLRLAATILVDGFVAGTWKVEKVKKTATLAITPFIPLAAQHRAALSEEGERLLRFVEAEAKQYAVKFEE
ncbi:MAG: winged helix DNA-binding domain-containing protein [Anaerolineae bacterium]